ncbi:MAG: FecR domain-containing protein [Planctomycetes bacterium]|nr:FecR domain-containing protein [Planctomycetota bacterium]
MKPDSDRRRSRSGPRRSHPDHDDDGGTPQGSGRHRHPPRSPGLSYAALIALVVVAVGVAALVCLFVKPVGSLAPIAAAGDESELGRVKRSSRDAHIILGGVAANPRPGEAVASGASLQTTADGLLSVTLGNQTQLDLSGETMLEALTASPGRAPTARLTRGTVAIDATHATGGRSLVVTTAFARIDAASGTCQVVAAADRTRVAVTHGSITLAKANGQQAMPLVAGQHGSVGDSGDPVIEVASRFVRGVNFGGDAVMIAGDHWLSHRQALKAGLELTGGTQVAAPRPIKAPGLDFDMKSLLDAGLTASGPIRIFQQAPNGDYDVILYITDPGGIDPAAVTVNILNRTIPTGDSSAGSDTWKRLGPYRCSVKDHRLDIAVTGARTLELSGMALFSVGALEGGFPAYGTITVPGDHATFVSLDDIPLAVDLGTTGGIAKVAYANGSTVVAEASKPPFSATWTHPPPGAYNLVATVTTTDGATTRTAAVSGMVEDAKKPNTLLYEYWDAMGDGSLAKMRADPRFAQPPSGYRLLKDGFCAPTDFRDHFGARIRGYLIPPADGAYIFCMVSDDAGEFSLGTDDKPASKRLITSVPEYTGYDEWSKYPTQSSAPVTLVKGRRYYIEALYSDGVYGDILKVGWTLPDGTLQRPIPAACLAPFAP